MMALSSGLRTPLHSKKKPTPWKRYPRVVTVSLSALESSPGKHWRMGEEEEQVGVSGEGEKKANHKQGKSY